MVEINAVGLLENSRFRSANQVPLPEDLKIEKQAPKQGEDSNNEDEGTKSPETRELSQQIDSHVVVLDDDNLRTTTTSTLDAAQFVLSSDPPPTNPPTSHEAPTITPTVPENPST